MKKNYLWLIALVLVAGGAFYGGILYGKSSSKFTVPNFQNLTAEQRQQMPNSGDSQRFSGKADGQSFLDGEIIAKEDQNLTVKLGDGGSKIIFFSESTSIGKTSTGTPADLEIGKQIIVNGNSNSDGSLTARSIQLRYDLSPDPFNGNQ